MRKIPLKIAFALFILIFGSCSDQTKQDYLSQSCVRSFDDFAYSLPEWEPNLKIDKIFPSSPWEMEAQLPDQQEEGFAVWDERVISSRIIDGKTEIWLTRSLVAAHDSQLINKTVFLIFRPAFKVWETISSEINGVDGFVKDLYVTNDKRIWGNIVGYPTVKDEKSVNIPVLSKFNESTSRFEPVPGILEIESNSVLDGSNQPKVVVDSQDMFWIFVDNDGVYRYDPFRQITEKRIDLSNFIVKDVALAPDGSITIEKYTDRIYSKETFFQLVNDVLFQYIPEENVVVPLEIPEEPWPVVSGFLVDHTGRLWLGAIGYRALDGEWHLIHPNPEEYFAHAGDISWAPSPNFVRKFKRYPLVYKGFGWGFNGRRNCLV